MEITFDPYKKVSFRSHMGYETSEEFARALAMSRPAGVPAQMTLFWANSVLFRYFGYAPSTPLAKELVNGHLIWDHVEFAPMQTYVREIQGPPDRPLVTINVLDVSKHAVFGPITKWIHDNLIK